MRRPALAFAILAIPCVVPSTLQAASDLTVLPQGRYGCWTSGSASGSALNSDAERSFTIVRGSSYATDAGSGTYLLAKDMLTFTRGPFKDSRFRRNKDGFWQEVARDGGLARLKCHRTGSALMSDPAESPAPTAPDPSEPDKD